VSSIEQDYLLLKGLENQQDKSINQIYLTHYPMVQRLVVNNNGTLDDAADVFQEAMIVLYEKAIDSSFQLNCQLKTFIYSICRRIWLKKLLQQKKMGPQVVDFEDSISVEDDIEAFEIRQQHFNIMDEALKKIGEPCKSLLEAYYFNKKHMLDIAKEFNYTNADNAKTQKYKCLMRLKKLFFAAYKNI
jgi:RNA polymerase sigma factor (sigma-70 family)